MTWTLIACPLGALLSTMLHRKAQGDWMANQFGLEMHITPLLLDRDSDLRIVTEGEGKFKTNYQAQKQVMPSLIPSLRMTWRS